MQMNEIAYKLKSSLKSCYTFLMECMENEGIWPSTMDSFLEQLQCFLNCFLKIQIEIWEDVI